MQNADKLNNALENLSDKDHYIFSVSDFYQLFPKITPAALGMLLSRAAKSGIFERICKGFYIYPEAPYERGFELYHTAARLREDTFCYLSLESVLSEAGVISQIPLGWITLMTEGRSGVINCGKYGKIEFIHTKKNPENLSGRLIYDKRYKLWRASLSLALEDMRSAQRPLDLIDTEDKNESV
ncbi:MAG: hypothetical protein LBL61_06810 [Elusimicrobiota bacterium]|jgi:predicted transcriptional regulator of viral defense system|nr:hypothetical protein [Elusimicrobiota bacterium]